MSRVLRALGVGSTAVAMLLLFAACEDSTSGADRVRAVDDAGDAAVVADATTSETAAPDALAPSACVACANAKAGEELANCGEACDSAMACIASCVSSDCEARCFRNAATLNATRFKVKLLSTCQKECTSIFDLAAAVTEYGAAFCARSTACAPALFPYRYPAGSSCPIQTASELFWSSLLPGSGVSGTVLRACAQTIASLDCTDFLSPQLDLACQVRGTRLTGQSCLGDAQCETGFCPSVDRGCAQCTIAPAEGQACIGRRCAAGLRCTTGNSCVRTARVGDACTTRPCEPPASCIAGVCQAPSATVGTPCGAGTVGCDNENGFICPNAATPTCAPFVAVGAGETCGPTGGTFRICHHALACAAGTCPPIPKPGDACTTDTTCSFPDRCIQSKCTALPPTDSCP